MQQVLNFCDVIDHDRCSLNNAIKDTTFKDLEDSCHMQVALKGECKALITFNTSDFKGQDEKELPVYSPASFLDKYRHSKKV